MRIEQIADLIDEEIVIRYYPNQNMRFSAHFDNGEVMENGCLGSAFENGKTADEAIRNYARKIAGKRLAFNAMKPDRRREFTMPKDLE